MIQRIIAATLALFALGAALWFGGSVAAQSATPPTECRPADINCDGQVDVVDLQQISQAIGAPAPAAAGRLDVNGDGLVDQADLTVAQRHWRAATIAQADDADGRLGYAVDDAGNVFVRWQLPTSPYDVPVEVLREPPPAGAPAAGVKNAGVVATVAPITDNATALPLLGIHWETLRNGFETDANGDPVALGSIAEVHNYVEQGINPMLADWLANREPGVARVFGLGYQDAAFTGTGVYTYWVRQGATLLGPLTIDTRKRTALPAPLGLSAFDGAVEIEPRIPTVGGAVNSATRQKALRIAHANVFLNWNLDLGLSESNPIWPNGFNVWRRTCDPGPINCGGWELINEYPIFPQPTPSETTAPASAGNGVLNFGAGLHDFDYHWADFDLNTAQAYCYSVTALDLFAQDSPLSSQACLQPPDYLPTQAPVFERITTVENPATGLYDVGVTFNFDPAAPNNADWQAFELYRAPSAQALWPEEWERVTIFSPDRCGEDMVIGDSGLSGDEAYWYRLVVRDRAGNLSAPTAPAQSKPQDTTPPAAPTFCPAPNGSRICRDADSVMVHIYRRYEANGFPLLVDRVPADTFAWASWSDPYAPQRETTFFYELRAADATGNLSDLSTLGLTKVLSVGQAQPLTPPVLQTVQIDAGYNGQLTWTAAAGANISAFNIYRAQGDTAPSLAAMSLIATETPDDLGSGDENYSYTDAASLRANAIYWYAVEAVSVAGERVASSPYPVRYVNLDDSSARPQESLLVRANWGGFSDPPGVQLYIRDNDMPFPPQCCYVVFRSRSPNDGFIQITPIIPWEFLELYLDTDVQPGDEFYYQVLRINAGSFTGNSIDPTTARGEIIARSSVVRVTDIPPADYGYIPATAPQPGFYIPRPGDPPAVLRFGAWDVTVRQYTNSTLSNLAGTGFVSIETTPGANFQVRVDFSGVNAPSGGVVQSVSGNATVQIGRTAVNHPDRIAYYLENMRLDPTGARADLTITAFGPDFRRYTLANSGPGAATVVRQANTFFADRSLRFSQTVPVDQSCLQPRANLAFPFVLSDWALTIVPTADFTVSETGVQFGSTCTVYQDRFSGLEYGDEPVPAQLNYRNDHYLRGIYASTQPASYSKVSGLSGTWANLLPLPYTTAFPFGFEISGGIRAIRFTDGVLSDGELLNGDLNFSYRTATNNATLDTFSGTFSRLSIAPNGALTGDISSTDPLGWTAFSVATGDYFLYTPATLTDAAPSAAWPASLGTSASGLSGDEREQPGLNAHQHNLNWLACPTPADPAEPIFPANAESDVDLYVRRGGVSGSVEMQPPGDGVDVSLAAYQWRFTSFAQSWLDNWPTANATTGDITLPYPADVTFSFDQLLLDESGCVVSGSVLPREEELAYWQLTIRPWALFFDDANKLWIELETAISNLERIDGAASDPQVAIAAAFNPNGTFHDGEVYAQDTVYTVDDFYVVLNDLRLSNYTAAVGSRERPGWDAAATLAPAPCLPQSVGCSATPGLEGGFVELEAGVYLPFFGEATDPNADAIYLLGTNAYVGFNRRPLAEREISPALDIRLQFELLYAQAQSDGTASRWVGLATDSGRDISILDSKLVEVTIAEIPNTLVVEPTEARLFFGFPSATAAFLAADEAWNTLPGNSPAPNQTALETRFRNWCAAGTAGDDTGAFFDLGSAGWDCDLEAELAAHLARTKNLTDYRTLTDGIDDQLDPVEGIVTDWLPEARFADVHIGIPVFAEKLNSTPLQLQWVRGDATVVPIRDGDGRIVDGELDLLQMDSYVTIYNGERSGDDAKVLLNGDMSLEWDPQGSFYLAAEDLYTTLIDLDVRLDADLRLLFDIDDLGYGIEGGITMYDIETEVGEITRVGAVAGFTVRNNGIYLLYVGAELDMWIDFENIGNINVGGSFLFGRLDPNSPVLERQYADVLDALGEANGAIQGAYMQVYANNVPIFELLGSCPGVKISGGGEVAFWIFTEIDGPDTAWGVRLGVNATGKALCVASVKASVTLQLDNDFGEAGLDLSGEAWAGAGCGFCEPEEWRTQADVRNDKGCLKCILTLEFLVPLRGSPTEPEFDFSGECPF